MLRYLTTLADAVALGAFVQPAYELCLLGLAQLLVLARGEAAGVRMEGRPGATHLPEAVLGRLSDRGIGLVASDELSHEG